MSGQEGYEDRLLAFLDILGFSNELTRSATDPERATWLINTFLSLDAQLQNFRTEEFQSTILSDTLCFSVPATQHVGVFLSGISLVTLSLLSGGIVLRGGITRGLLYHRGGLILGPSMVRGHQLESKIANVARIVIDPAMHYEPEPDLEFFQPTYEDTDGMQCLNFFDRGLYAVFSTMFAARSIPLPPLESFRPIIEARVVASPSEKERAKNQHLLDYLSHALAGPRPPTRSVVDFAARALPAVDDSADQSHIQK